MATANLTYYHYFMEKTSHTYCCMSFNGGYLCPGSIPTCPSYDDLGNMSKNGHDVHQKWTKILPMSACFCQKLAISKVLYLIKKSERRCK